MSYLERWREGSFREWCCRCCQDVGAVVYTLVEIRSKSDDSPAAIKTYRSTTSSMTGVKLRNSVLVSGGLAALGHEPEGTRREWSRFFYKKEPNISVCVSIEESSGSGIYRAMKQLKAFHNDRLSPESAAIASEEWADFAQAISLLHRYLHRESWST